MRHKRLYFSCAIVAAGAILALAAARSHPHLFIDSKVTFVFDDKGLAKILEEWTFDEMFSADTISEFDKDGDKVFSPEEIVEIEAKAFSNLKSFGYFTFVSINGKALEIEKVEDFSASIGADEQRVIYKFSVPCAVLASKETARVEASNFDESNYTDLALTDDSPALEFDREKLHAEQKVDRSRKIDAATGLNAPPVMIVTFKLK